MPGKVAPSSAKAKVMPPATAKWDVPVCPNCAGARQLTLEFDSILPVLREYPHLVDREGVFKPWQP